MQLLMVHHLHQCDSVPSKSTLTGSVILSESDWKILYYGAFQLFESLNR